MERSTIAFAAFAALVCAAAVLAGCLGQSQSSTLGAPTTTAYPGTPGPNCGSDYGCFINLAQQCSQGQVTASFQEPLNGLIYNVSQLMALNPSSSGCSLFVNNTAVTVSVDPNSLQQALANGTTMDEINAAVAMAQNESQQAVGIYATCTFENLSDLNMLLNEWGAPPTEEDAIIANQLLSSDCVGPMFQQGSDANQTDQELNPPNPQTGDNSTTGGNSTSVANSTRPVNTTA